MTTGRINQVTIVRRGWPPAPVRAPERFKLLVAPRGRAAHSTVGRANSAAHGNPLSPSKFPRASVHRTEPAVGRCGLGAPGGGRSAQLQPLRCPLHEVTSRCSVVDLARGQSSTEPNRRRPEPKPTPLARHPQYAVPPGRPVS